MDDDYVITSEVGRGKFGVVKIARAKKNDKKYAIKIINKFHKSTTEEDYKIFQWEKSIFLFLNPVSSDVMAKSERQAHKATATVDMILFMYIHSIILRFNRHNKVVTKLIQ